MVRNLGSTFQASRPLGGWARIRGGVCGGNGAGDPRDTGLEHFAMNFGPDSVGKEKAPWSSRSSRLVAGRRSSCLAQRTARVWTSRSKGLL